MTVRKKKHQMISVLFLLINGQKSTVLSNHSYGLLETVGKDVLTSITGR